jgi:hypothetical protein
MSNTPARDLSDATMHAITIRLTRCMMLELDKIIEEGNRIKLSEACCIVSGVVTTVLGNLTKDVIDARGEGPKELGKKLPGIFAEFIMHFSTHGRESIPQLVTLFEMRRLGINVGEKLK